MLNWELLGLGGKFIGGWEALKPMLVGIWYDWGCKRAGFGGIGVVKKEGCPDVVAMPI